MDLNNAQQLAQQSFARMAAKDREGWVGLFADDAIVQDPVGKSPLDPSGEGLRGKAAIAGFFDMVNSMGQIRGEVHESHRAHNSCANLVTLTTTLENGEQSQVRTIAVYTCNDDNKITSLKTYWTWEDQFPST